MYVKNDSKPAKKISKFLGILFALIYALLFIPSLLFIPQLGAFSLDADGVTALGAMLCIFVLAIIPFSMPFSIYLIYSRFAQVKYGQMFFFCFLPLLCSIIAPLLVLLIVCLYDHELASSLVAGSF